MSGKNREAKRQKIRQKARIKELKRKKKVQKRFEKAKEKQARNFCGLIAEITREEAIEFAKKQEHVKSTFDKAAFRASQDTGNTQQASERKPVLKGRSEGFDTKAWQSFDRPQENEVIEEPYKGFDVKAWNSHG